jgi:hypothetical protein
VLKDLGFLAAVVAAVALPFALVHCDPLIDGHGYMGDETMILALAMNGAMDGIQSYGTEPNGTPLVWPGWIPLVTAVYGPALLGTDPLRRVEMGRLISRVLCMLGALALTLSAHHVIHKEPSGRRTGGRLVLLGLLVSLTLVAFPPFVFVASFARNDALGLFLLCLTLPAAVVFIRRNATPAATALLIFVAGGNFWGHFVSLLLSCYLAGVAIVLVAVRAWTEDRFAHFCRNVAAGLLAGAGGWCLLFLWLNGEHFLSGSTGGGRADLLVQLCARLAANVTDVRAMGGEGLRLWASWKELPLLLAAVGVAAIVTAIPRRRDHTASAGLGFMPGPVVVMALQVPLLTAAMGALAKTYPLHDVYRPLVLVAVLSMVLLAIEIQPWNASTRERTCFALLIATALGLFSFARWDTTAFSEFPGIFTEWRGYRPFDHTFRDTDWPEAAARELAHRRGNQERRHHLEQLTGHLRRERVGALITFEPMLVLLRSKGLTPYYIHFQVPPAARASATHEGAQIVLSTILGRGVRIIAATRNGLDELTFSTKSQPLHELGGCIRTNWRRPVGFQCQLGPATLSLEPTYRTDGGRYRYGNEDSTPIRLYRIAEVRIEGTSVR